MSCEEKKDTNVVDATIEERCKVYGDPFNSHTNIGKSWTALIQQHYNLNLPHDIPAFLVAEMMVCFKMQRSAVVYKDDNFIDAHAYAKFAEEFQRRHEKEKVKKDIVTELKSLRSISTNIEQVLNCLMGYITSFENRGVEEKVVLEWLNRVHGINLPTDIELVLTRLQRTGLFVRSNIYGTLECKYTLRACIPTPKAPISNLDLGSVAQYVIRLLSIQTPMKLFTLARMIEQAYAPLSSEQWDSLLKDLDPYITYHDTDSGKANAITKKA